MHLSEINIYPIKSLKGIPLQVAVVEDRGLKYDRRWMLVDDDGRFLTQREHPAMARIGVRIEGDELIASFGGEELRLPMESDTGKRVRVKVWSSTLKAEEYPAETGEWFSDALGMQCRMVRMPEGERRLVNPFYAVRKFKDVVSFADGYPFLLIGQASLDDLNSRLEAPVPMNRFRPSLVVAGAEPFAEDNWKKIRIGPTVFHLVKPCGRCVVTTIDQQQGEKTGPEPLKTLSGYRKKGDKVLFGQNMIAEKAGGTLRLGDEVEVLESRRSKEKSSPPG